MKRISTSALLISLALAIAAPAVAKMPGFKLAEGRPPVVGQPYVLIMTLSDSLPEGMDVTGVVELKSPVPGEAPLRPVFIVSPGGEEMRADVIFPSPGEWVLVAFPGIPERETVQPGYSDGATIEVLELPPAAAAHHGGAGRLGRPVMLGGAAVMLLAALGLAARTAGRPSGSR